MIGDPVAHSLSPAIHNAAFAEAGIEATFVAVPVRADELGAAITAFRKRELLGLSVTMPHKAAIQAHLDVVGPEAAALDAVNCVVPEGDQLVGVNTDGVGFVDALAAVSVDLVGTRVLVLGAGGAARAVVHALAGEDPAEIGIANRSPDRAKAAVLLGGRDARIADVDEAPDFDLIVNATSVGMGTDELPLPAELLREGQTVVDLVYQPVDTALLAAARSAGARAVDGVGMLVHQAAHAFRLWTGVDAPVAVMEAAARRELAAKT